MGRNSGFSVMSVCTIIISAYQHFPVDRGVLIAPAKNGANRRTAATVSNGRSPRIRVRLNGILQRTEMSNRGMWRGAAIRSSFFNATSVPTVSRRAWPTSRKSLKGVGVRTVRFQLSNYVRRRTANTVSKVHLRAIPVQQIGTRSRTRRHLDK